MWQSSSTRVSTLKRVITFSFTHTKQKQKKTNMRQGRKFPLQFKNKKQNGGSTIFPSPNMDCIVIFPLIFA